MLETCGVRVAYVCLYSELILSPLPVFLAEYNHQASDDPSGNLPQIGTYSANLLCAFLLNINNYVFFFNCGSQHSWKKSFRFQAGLEPGTLCFSIMVLDHPTMPAWHEGNMDAVNGISVFDHFVVGLIYSPPTA